LHYNGGYGEYAVAEESNLIRLPENVTFAQAAVAAESMVTAFHAVTVQGEVDTGQTVAIIGLGRLGMMAARISVLKGAIVYGVDTDQSKFELAKHNGVK
jgi:propanol-preferring alcohol dehydrogenase